MQRIEEADREAAAQKELQLRLARTAAPMSELTRKSELDVILNSTPGLRVEAPSRPRAR